MAPEVSVVICSHNGERLLPGALDSIRRQSVPGDRYEVLVVDDGSTDRTAEIGAAAGARTIRLRPNRGIAAARNAGSAAASAPIVAFTDDDCEADPDWLRRLLEAFGDAHVEAVGGSVMPVGSDGLALRYLRALNPLTPLGAELLASNSPLYRLLLYLRRAALGHPPMSAGDRLYSVVGANMAFRRELLERVGGFDEAFRFGGEEEDLCRRAHGLSPAARIVYAPEAVVAHRFPPQLRDTLRRARAYGRGNARTALKHPAVRPIVYPFPLLVAGILATGVLRRSPGAAVLAGLVPAAAYPRWAGGARRRRSLEPLLYPYLQLAQEAATMLGEVESYRAGYDGDRG